MRGFAGSTGSKSEAISIYVALPLYHATGGLCALGAALLNGGSVFLRRQVLRLASFGSEAADEGCTMFVYIGELCRYLVNQPPGEDETRHKIRHGLRQRPASGHLAGT